MLRFRCYIGFFWIYSIIHIEILDMLMGFEGLTLALMVVVRKSEDGVVDGFIDLGVCKCISL